MNLPCQGKDILESNHFPVYAPTNRITSDFTSETMKTKGYKKGKLTQVETLIHSIPDNDRIDIFLQIIFA